MPRDSRDQGFEKGFEKALARHLRSAMPGGSSAQPTDACADTEILAAYHERRLSFDEVNFWKQHLVGCERCQQILAQLEIVEEAPVDLQATEREKETALAGAADRVATPPGAAAGTPIIPERDRFARRQWQWIAPVGALAAGLLLWITWRGNQMTMSHFPNNVQVAKDSRAAAPPPPSSVRGEQNEVAAPDKSALDKTKSSAEANVASAAQKKEAAAGTLAAESRRLADAERDAAALSQSLHQYSRAKTSGTPSKDLGPSNRALQQNIQQQNATIEDLKADRASSEFAYKLAPPSAESKKAPVPAAASPSPPPPKGEAAPAEAADQVPAKQPAAVQAYAPASAVTESRAGAVLTSNGSRLIPVPGGKVLWSIDPDGRIRRSTDGGQSWQLNDVGFAGTWLAGSAPSENVCWLAGTFGAVLLTTDAGAHWSKLSTPISAPIGTVVARDAQHAVVTLQSSKVRLETSDGGQTWTLVQP